MKQTINSKNRKMVFLLGCIIAIFTVVCYANSLGNDFIWDDEYLILNNEQIKSFSHIKNIFKTYVGYGSGNVNNFYRPLQELSNMVDYFLWGEEPFGYHLTNILLHLLCAIAMFILIFYITGSLAISFITALLFAIHPINTEAVTYIAGRADPLYSLFFIISLTLYIRFCNRVINSKSGGMLYFWSLACFVFSLMSKELAIVLPVVIFLYIFLILPKMEMLQYGRKKIFITASGFVVIAAIYTILRATILDFSNIAPPSVFSEVPIFYRIFTFFKATCLYIALLIFPYNLHMERTITVTTSLFEPVSVLAALIVLGIVLAGFLSIKKDKVIAFFIFWFFIILFPVSNIVPINSLIAEHWLYMPQIGFFATILLTLGRIYKRMFYKYKSIPKFLGAIVLFFISSLYITKTIERNRDWRDEITFFKTTLRYSPNNPRLHLNLGNTYFEKGKLEEAIKEYKKAISLDEDCVEGYSNIGVIYMEWNNLEKAKTYLNKAISKKPDFAIAHYNLGKIYFLENKFQEAEKEFILAVNLFPNLYQAHNFLGEIYLNWNKRELAEKHFLMSLQINPKQNRIDKILQYLQQSNGN